MEHKCEACVVTCIDFRLQDAIYEWTVERFGKKNHDRVAFAGGVKDFETIQKQFEISQRLHDVKQLVLVNHEDCGAYGAEGTQEKHATDLKNAAAKFQQQFPDLKIETHYLHLDGTFEKVD